MDFRCGTVRVLNQLVYYYSFDNISSFIFDMFLRVLACLCVFRMNVLFYQKKRVHSICEIEGFVESCICKLLQHADRAYYCCVCPH